MRFLKPLLALAVSMALCMPAGAQGIKGKHAALVMDADTGAVLYEDSAHERRYPASLTKMMTLYMVFDALRTGEMRLSDRMQVSKNAAAQPQTNISLKPGVSIPVELGIKALVVRSANDVSVVFAEHLGRSEWNFGVMMTSKARQLGMKETVFRNPNGLPDNRQYTTAYDMALLGRALRHDFPQYYHYFETREFAYNGRTYKSHNRVLDQFDGVDGIKTGYIRASGFNLVSSVKKDGYSVVAVVMGGMSSRSRDADMVAMLTETFNRLEQQKDAPRAFAAAPDPAMNPRRAALELAAAQEQKQQTAQAPLPAVPAIMSGEDIDRVAAPKMRFAYSAPMEDSPAVPEVELSFLPQAVAAEAPIPALTQNKAASRRAPEAPAPVASAPAPSKNTLNFQLAMLDGKMPVPSTPRDRAKGWGIQVGAFSDADQARAAVSKAVSLVHQDLKDATVAIATEEKGEAPIHRARLENLSQSDAYAACKKLVAMKTACFPLEMN